MHVDISTLLILCPLIFIAGFIDSIAGGGGLISLPSYILVGLPVHAAYGTNKFSSCCGTLFSAARYLKDGRIHLPSALSAAALALVGSFFGAKAALAMDEKFLQYCLIVLIPVIAVFVLTKRNFGESDRTAAISARRVILLSMLSGFFIGAYDGFFGPGTGTFLILIYTGVIGFDLTTASGNAKVVNLASNIAALITFFGSGVVRLELGIPAAFFGILGNWIGSGLAIRKGSRVIKPVFMLVITLLLVKIVTDIF